jgi:hypothetical protein
MLQVLNPTKEIKVHGDVITVQEMRWPDAVDFFNRLASGISLFLDEKGQVSINPKAITQMVTSSAELSTLLILRSTGKDEAWLKQIGVCAALDVLDLALELNLSEELIAKGKKLAGRVKDAFTNQRASASMPSPKPSTT